MIKSKEDLNFFLEADRIALGVNLKHPRLFQDEVWRFQRLLRKVEFIENCGKNGLNRITLFGIRFRFNSLSVKLGFTIFPNVFGPGLSIAHRGPIVIHRRVRIGENCRIHHCVTIGTLGTKKVPRIGKNVFIGTGAVIAGDIEIADGIAIGANSFVNQSFKESNITIAGCPAKKVSNKGSKHCWWRATERMRNHLK